MVSISPKTPAGWVTSGRPSSRTRPSNIGEPSQKKPAGIGWSAKLVKVSVDERQ